jgi:hypothetical protein
MQLQNYFRASLLEYIEHLRLSVAINAAVRCYNFNHAL